MKRTKIFLILFLCLCLFPYPQAQAADSNLRTTVEDVLKIVAAQALFQKIAPAIGLGPKKTDEEKEKERILKEEKKEKKELDKAKKEMEKEQKGEGKEAGKNTSLPTHIDLVQQWANKGDVQAQCILSYAYETGQRVPQDHTLAIIWQNRAANQNIQLVKNFIPVEYGKEVVPLEKLFSLAGRRSHVGKYVEQNLDDAVRWCSMAAAEKDAAAVAYLGSAYYTGRGVKQDYKNAVFCANLTKKDPLSLHVLINAYMTGNGVKKDIDKSKFYSEYLKLVVERKRSKEQNKRLKKYEREIEKGELYGIVR